MKTKSKRFLKLAPLCMALLGTTLLTTQPQPVKAEGCTPNVMEKGHESARQTLTDVGQTENDEYELGYKEGYEAGRKKGAPREPDDDALNNNSSSYGNGYYPGYYRGWDETNHPFQTLLDDIYRWLWENFFRWL
ncbi:Uncharacterised protein [Streptococcus pyogenes]|uniref:hypothetical protein n=1 Tax=Streptococcus pyogenes TaxID=1314 RepID=UPI0010A1DD4C|nr:hypothetical protein [Streptococcus pyogenes]VHB76394.1 Uncharacterised protein [Streptococcus pyogenes]